MEESLTRGLKLVVSRLGTLTRREIQKNLFDARDLYHFRVLGLRGWIFVKHTFELFRELETRPMKPAADSSDRQVEGLANRLVTKSF